MFASLVSYTMHMYNKVTSRSTWINGAFGTFINFELINWLYRAKTWGKNYCSTHIKDQPKCIYWRLSTGLTSHKKKGGGRGFSVIPNLIFHPELGFVRMYRAEIGRQEWAEKSIKLHVSLCMSNCMNTVTAISKSKTKYLQSCFLLLLGLKPTSNSRTDVTQTGHSICSRQRSHSIFSHLSIKHELSESIWEL